MALARIQFDTNSEVKVRDSTSVFSGGFTPVNGDYSYESLLAKESVVSAGSSGIYHWVQGRDFTLVECSQEVSELESIGDVASHFYVTLLNLIPTLDHQNLVRFWNCIPHINYGDGDHEVYKRFCAGRLAGFQMADIADCQFPAASALGHKSQRLTTHMLLSGFDVEHHENPLQINAFEYPPQYGNSSPSFARATEVFTSNPKPMLFVSGTASIRGHETFYLGDVSAQTTLSIDNIEVLLKQANKVIDDIASLRVYIRDADDVSVVMAMVNDRMPKGSRSFLQADICRSDLLVEIECIAQ